MVRFYKKKGGGDYYYESNYVYIDDFRGSLNHR